MGVGVGGDNRSPGKIGLIYYNSTIMPVKPGVIVSTFRLLNPSASPVASNFALVILPGTIALSTLVAIL